MKTAAIAKMPDGLCAGCGRPIDMEPTLKLANGAIVHFANYDCLIQYGNLREAIGKPQQPAKANIPTDEQSIAADSAGNAEIRDNQASETGPKITPADALGDITWFAAHSERRFRARAGNDGIWLIRRRPQADIGRDTILRTFSSTTEPPGDTDDAIAVAWLRAAYPDWPLEKVRKVSARALKKRAAR